MSESFEQRKQNLLMIRHKFLRFHKILLDWDRANYEKEPGVVSSGKFLERLLGDPRFQWLRTISTLIVRLDESFELDDGMSKDMVEGFFEEIGNLFDDSEEYTEFKSRLSEALPENESVVELRQDIIDLLS